MEDENYDEQLAKIVKMPENLISYSKTRFSRARFRCHACSRNFKIARLVLVHLEEREHAQRISQLSENDRKLRVMELERVMRGWSGVCESFKEKGQRAAEQVHLMNPTPPARVHTHPAPLRPSGGIVNRTPSSLTSHHALASTSRQALALTAHQASASTSHQASASTSHQASASTSHQASASTSHHSSASTSHHSSSSRKRRSSKSHHTSKSKKKHRSSSRVDDGQRGSSHRSSRGWESDILRVIVSSPNVGDQPGVQSPLRDAGSPPRQPVARTIRPVMPNQRPSASAGPPPLVSRQTANSAAAPSTARVPVFQAVAAVPVQPPPPPQTSYAAPAPAAPLPSSGDERFRGELTLEEDVSRTMEEQKNNTLAGNFIYLISLCQYIFVELKCGSKEDNDVITAWSREFHKMREHRRPDYILKLRLSVLKNLSSYYVHKLEDVNMTKPKPGEEDWKEIRIRKLTKAIKQIDAFIQRCDEEKDKKPRPVLACVDMLDEEKKESSSPGGKGGVQAPTNSVQVPQQAAPQPTPSPAQPSARDVKLRPFTPAQMDATATIDSSSALPVTLTEELSRRFVAEHRELLGGYDPNGNKEELKKRARRFLRRAFPHANFEDLVNRVDHFLTMILHEYAVTIIAESDTEGNA